MNLVKTYLVPVQRFSIINEIVLPNFVKTHICIRARNQLLVVFAFTLRGRITGVTLRESIAVTLLGYKQCTSTLYFQQINKSTSYYESIVFDIFCHCILLAGVHELLLTNNLK